MPACAISKDRQIAGDGDVLSSTCRLVNSCLNRRRGIGNIDDLQPGGTTVHRSRDVSGCPDNVDPSHPMAFTLEYASRYGPLRTGQIHDSKPQPRWLGKVSIPRQRGRSCLNLSVYCAT